MTSRSFLFVLIILCLLAGAARLPQFLSGNLVVDGDESITGLMAKHLLEGKDANLFFFGQHHGFTLLESAIAAIFFGLFGISTFSLKTAMLILWIAGSNLIVLAVRNFEDETAALFCAVFLFFTPGWAAWSLKARGGYLTAFLLFGAAFWLISRLNRGAVPPPRSVRAIFPFVLLGIIFGIMFMAQPYFVLAVLYFIPLAISGQSRPWMSAAAFLGAAFVLVPYLVYALGAGSGSWFSLMIATYYPRFDPAWVARCLTTALGGNYYYTDPIHLGGMTVAAGVAGAGLALVLTAVLGYRWLMKRRYDIASAGLLSFWSVLGTALFVHKQNFGFRYLLPLPTLLAILAGVFFKRFLWDPAGRRVAAAVIAGSMMLVHVAAQGEFRLYTYYGRAASPTVREHAVLKALIAKLKGRHIGHVFCQDELFQGILVFESNEQIICRSQSHSSRIPVYIDQVDQAYREGRNTALVGLYQQRRRVQRWLKRYPQYARNYRTIDRRYFLFLSPPKSLLEMLNFQLN